MKNDAHVIWSNYGLNYDDWKDYLEEEYPDMSEAGRIDMMYEMNSEYLDDERVSLNIQLSRPILVIGDIGRWNGRVMGYKEIRSGNVADCLYSDTDYATWYVDDKGELRCDAVHHDGTNYYRYRAYRPNASQEQIDKLKEKLYTGTATEKDISMITTSLGDKIAKVYGWELSKPHISKGMER